MMPSGGFYLIVHLVVLLINRVFRFVKKAVIPSAIMTAVFALAAYGVYATVGGALDSENNLELYQNLTFRCLPPNPEIKPKKIIIRIDDIQAYWLRDVQIKMLDELYNRNIPALLGVIPLNLKDDTKLTGYLRKHYCSFEIAMRGYDQGKDVGYNVPEFANLPEADAYDRIMQAMPVLAGINRGPLTTFIPPRGVYSTGTVSALIKAGFKEISASGDGLFDATANTYDFSTRQAVPLDDVIKECQTALDKKDVCTIVIYPQSISTNDKLDPEKYRYFTDLLDRASSLDAQISIPKDMIFWYQLQPPQNSNSS